MGEERCEYNHDVSRLPDVGPACCWRPTWKESERCVWHADVDEKSESVLSDAASEPGDRLDGANLRAASLPNGNRFAGCKLIGADFSLADVRAANFTDADLREVSFENANAQNGNFDRANLEDAVMRGTDIRGASFVDTKLDEVDLSRSRINRATAFGTVSIYETELFESDDPTVQREKYEAATWTYRMLQRVAEDNARRGQMYDYYQLEKDLRRRFSWKTKYYTQAIGAEISRWTMGYGYNIWRILGTSALFIIICAISFPLTGGILEADSELVYTLNDPETEPTGHILLVFYKSLYFSTITFATLGYGDIQPIGPWARALAAIESLMGGILMALIVVVLFQRITGFRQ